MKKFLMIAVAAMAVASQAANVLWQLSTTTDTGFAEGQQVLLFLGGASETFSYGGTDNLSLADYVNALLADGADTAAGKAFDSATTAVNRRGQIYTDAKSQDISYAAGSDIVGMMVVLDGNGKYRGYSLSGTVAGSGDTVLNTAMPSAQSTTNGGFVDLPGGGSQIPEPATGALALAGLALLFKRRRA